MCIYLKPYGRVQISIYMIAEAIILMCAGRGRVKDSFREN